MMDLDGWPHRWFGYWREYGPKYLRCPSIREFVRPDVTATYDKARLRRYLTSAACIAATSRAAFPDPFTGERLGGSVSWRTDGRWTWMDNLPDYIEEHDVALPTAFLREIVARDYVAPPVDPRVFPQLESPPVG